MTIDNVLEILEKHKLYIPSNVFYELKADIVNFEEPTTKNNLGVDKLLAGCEKMSFEIEIFNKPLRVVALDAVKNIVKDLFSVTPQESTDKCRWIKYDHRTMCPKEHDVDNPYWRIPENRMETLKYCPYCGKEIEVEK